MGEYGRIKSSGKVVKLGVCEELFYLRFEDVKKVKYEQHQDVFVPLDPDGSFFRLPWPEEDGIEVGCYEYKRQGIRLWKQVPESVNKSGWKVPERNINFEDSDPDFANHPGIIQLKSDGGMLVNVQCYHGIKLPENGKDAKFFWNGKSWHMELQSVKCVKGKIRYVVGCKHCGKAWSFCWEEIKDWVHNKEMIARFEKYPNMLKSEEEELMKK